MLICVFVRRLRCLCVGEVVCFSEQQIAKIALVSPKEGHKQISMKENLITIPSSMTALPATEQTSQGLLVEYNNHVRVGVTDL